MTQNDKNVCLWCPISYEPCIIWSLFMDKCVKGWYIQVFFLIFSKFFGVNSGVKRQKMTQNDKKLCLSHSKSQEAYFIWSWFLVHKNKMMTFPDTFFVFFQNFDFQGERSKCKKWPKMIKNYVCFTMYLRNHTSSDFGFLVCMCKMMMSQAIFFIFSKFWYFGFCPMVQEGETQW